MKDVVDPILPGAEKVTAARFLGFDAEGYPRVAVQSGDPVGVVALSLVALAADQAGREVALAWLDGDPPRPLILGLIQPPICVAEADGERMVIEARREVVLRCGKASITLRPDGSITLRGGQILSRADGANRVQGASVQLN